LDERAPSTVPRTKNVIRQRQTLALASPPGEVAGLFGGQGPDEPTARQLDKRALGRPLIAWVDVVYAGVAVLAFAAVCK
jgi:hypothetical protein